MAIVQDPQEAFYPSMPRSALAHVEIDYTLPLKEIAPLLVHTAFEHISKGDLLVSREALSECDEDKVSTMEDNDLQQEELKGHPSVFSCPECGGVLWEMQNGTVQRFRCRVGHAFSTESMLIEQSEELDKTLWMALKTLEEKVELLQRLIDNANQHGRTWLAQSFEARLKEAQRHAQTLRQVLVEGGLKLSDPRLVKEGQIPPLVE